MTHAEPPAVSDPNVTPTPVRPTVDNSAGRAVREVVETLILAAVIFLGVRLVVLNFRVDGESMIPNLHDQEMLLVNRNAYWHFDAGGLLGLIPGQDHSGSDVVYPFHAPERGDIVVFNPPVRDANKPYIKRVIGLPGEHVTFRGGSVLINGTPLDEPYISERTRCGQGEHCDVVVPQGDVFVLGDNRGNSQDSRYFGPTTVDSIIGKAWLGYWPLDSLGFVPHHDYAGISDQPIPATPQPAAMALPLAMPPAPVRAGRRRPNRAFVGAGGRGRDGSGAPRTVAAAPPQIG